MLTKKQSLILLLISSEPGIKGISSLMKLLDRADFPARISENLNELIKNSLINVDENFENGTAKNYKITEEGKSYLIENFNDIEIIEYVEQMNEPKLISEITKIYIDRKNSR